MKRNHYDRPPLWSVREAADMRRHRLDVPAGSMKAAIRGWKAGQTRRGGAVKVTLAPINLKDH